MKKAFFISSIVSILVLFAGCIIIDDSLDYRNDLSDYEVKKIVRTVLASQNTINRAGLVTSDGLGKIARQKSRYLNTNLSCDDGGYIAFSWQTGDFSATFITDSPLRLQYHECLYAPYYYDPYKVNGEIEIITHQFVDDYRNKLLDLTLHYYDTYLYTGSATIYLEGNIGVHYDYDYGSDYLAMVLTAPDFTIKNSSGYEKESFSNVVLNFQLDTLSQRYSYDYSGTLYNSYLGRLSFTTLEHMQGEGNRNPCAGRFKISNDDMSVIVVPYDDYYVDIYVDNRYHPSRNRRIHTTWINIGL